jgi:hypothetical protein
MDILGRGRVILPGWTIQPGEGMPERKVNPKLVALALARGATQVEAYKAGGGETDDDSRASVYCNRPDVARLRAYFEQDQLERLKSLLVLADTDAASVLSGEDEGATRMDRASARQYAAQRERTHTVQQVEISHVIAFSGLSQRKVIDATLDAESTSSLQRLEAVPDAPALPEGKPAEGVGDTLSLRRPPEVVDAPRDTTAT